MENKVAANKPEKPKKKGFRWFLWLVIVVIVFGIVAGFYNPSFYKSADEYIGKIVAKITGKEKDLPVPMASLAKAPKNVMSAEEKAVTTSQSIMFAKVDKKAVLEDEAVEEEEVIVEEKVETAPKSDITLPSNFESKKELNALKKRVDVLEEKLTLVAKERELGAALVMATMQLKDAAVAGKDFTSELNMLYGLAKDDKEMLGKIAALRPFASGVKTENELRKELPILVKTALKKTPENTGDFWDGVLAKIKTLVVIRKVDESGENEGENAALALAEKAAFGGDLTAAEAALEKLPEAKQKVFEKWCENAQNLLQVEALCDELTKLAVAKIGGENNNENEGENRP